MYPEYIQANAGSAHCLILYLHLAAYFLLQKGYFL